MPALYGLFISFFVILPVGIMQALQDFRSFEPEALPIIGDLALVSRNQDRYEANYGLSPMKIDPFKEEA